MKPAAVIVFGGVAAILLADLDGSAVLPLDHPAIQYNKSAVSDPVARLQGRLNSGEARLAYDAEFGYLPSILRELDAPVSSQVLVFSKTSFQATRISPRTPRALYFNDRVSVGYVHGGDVLEFASFDPRQGVIFYTLDQERAAKPKFDRQDQCLQCHASGATLGVPGLVVRSVFPERSGMPVFQAGGFITDHRSPLTERWGGWYVTGSHGEQLHMGNTVVEDKEKPDQFDRRNGANVSDLTRRFDTGAYLSPHSDIVALMILEHQTRMTNLLTRIGWETRMAIQEQESMNKAFQEPAGTMSESTERRIKRPVEELLRYMLFVDEPSLTASIHGISGFANDYQKLGPKDPAGRSLRQLDLSKRLLKYPCSPLIYSEAFDALPPVAKEHLYRRLWQVLSGEDRSPVFARLPETDRKAILGILRATKKELPEYWN